MSAKTYRYVPPTTHTHVHFSLSALFHDWSIDFHTGDYQDHPLLAINWEVTSNDTVLDNLTQNSTFAAEQLALWQANRTGYLVNSAGSQWGWLRVPANETSVYGGGSTKDPSSGPTAANYEFIFVVC